MTYWFGTDDLGRDVFSRTLAGASSTLMVAPAATAIGIAGGMLIGLCTGYFRGMLDDIVMRLVDSLLAFPLVIVAVLVMSVLGPSVSMSSWSSASSSRRMSRALFAPLCWSSASANTSPQRGS